MKILFLLHSAVPTDGSSIAVMSIIKQLLLEKHEIRVISGQDGNLLREFEKLGIKTFVFEYYGALYPSVSTIRSCITFPYHLTNIIYKNHLAEKNILEIAREFNPDIIHSNVGVIRVGYYVSKRLRIPHVWHVRETSKGLNLLHYPSLWWQKHLYKINNYNISITEGVKEFYNMSEKNTKVIYDGVFSSAYKLNTNIKKQNYFLFAGRICQAKGADWAVKAFLSIASKYPSMELWLAGNDSSSYAKELKRIVEQSNSSGKVKFLGVRNDVYELMAKAQAVLVPSTLEGFGFITVEAMVNKTIVIGRNSGGTKEQFDNGLKLCNSEIGLRCCSIQDMANHMEEICKKGQEDYREMIRMADKTVRSLYTIENNASNILMLYNKIRRALDK